MGQIVLKSLVVILIIVISANGERDREREIRDRERELREREPGSPQNPPNPPSPPQQQNQRFSSQPVYGTGPYGHPNPHGMPNPYGDLQNVDVPDISAIIKQYSEMIPKPDNITLLTLVSALTLITATIMGVDAAVILFLSAKPVVAQLMANLANYRLDGVEGQSAFAGFSDIMRQAFSADMTQQQPVYGGYPSGYAFHEASPIAGITNQFLKAFAKQFATSLTQAAIQGAQQNV